MLKRIAYTLIMLTALSYLIISCQTTPDSVISTLSKVEECMETHPDSALNLLKSIPHPETLHGKAQADYSLLMTQAMDKNYIKLESDSLISFAVGYYGSHGNDWVRRGKAYFYYGRVMKEMNRLENAMHFYLRAKEIFDETSEYKMLGLITEEIGNVNLKQKIMTESLLNYKKSKYYFEKAGDMLSASFALRNVGRTFLIINEFDSAYFYYQKALQISNENNCVSEFSILQEIGMMYRAKRDYSTARDYFLKALKLDSGKQVFSTIYLSLGYLYYQMREFTKAEEYLNLGINSSNLYTRADSYDTLFKLEKKRNNPWLAIDYKEKADSLRKVIQNEEVRRNLDALQRKYENEKLQKENLQIKIKYQTIILLCSIPSLLILFLVFYYYRRLRDNKKYIRELERQFSSNSEDIAMYQHHLENYQQLQDESKEIHGKIGELNGKLLMLQKHNQELTKKLNGARGESSNNYSDVDNTFIATFWNLLALKSGLLKGDLSTSEWQRLFELFDFLYNDYVKRLREYCPSLTKHDLEICCLLKIGFTNEELKRVFMTTSDSVTKAKGRLKKRLNLSVQEELEEFLKNF